MRYIFVLLLAVIPASAVAAAEPLRIQHEGLELHAELHLPAGPGPWPVAVFAPGSGSLPAAHPRYRRMSEALNRMGLGLLVPDKRGVGASGGEYQETPDYGTAAGDLAAWHRAVSRRPDVDTGRVGFLGFSQGGWLAPLAARTCDCAAFIVVMSGTPLPPYRQNAYQLAEEFVDRGMPMDQARAMEERLAVLWRYLGTGEGPVEAEAALSVLRDQPWFEQLGLPPELLPVEALDHPSLRHFRRTAYDPDPVMRALDVPMLWIFGALDRHIDLDASVARLREWQHDAPECPLSILILPGVGHVLTALPEGREHLIEGLRVPYEEQFLRPHPEALWTMLAGWLEAADIV